MTSGSRASIRTTAVALAALVSTVGLGVLTTPATAASDTLSYECDYGAPATVEAAAVVDTDAPASLTYGQTFPLQVSSVVTLPFEVVDYLDAQGVASVEGTADATGTVDGAARQATLTVPRTPVPSVLSDMVLTGAGPGGTITPGPTLPVIELGAGGFALALKGYNSSDEPVGDIDISCTLQPGQDAHVDSVEVLPASTTTTVAVQSSPIAYGASPSLTAEVAQTGSNAKPGGTVAFSLDGTTVTAPVQAGKAKVDLPPAFAIGVRTVTATFTPDAKNLVPSQASAFLTVVRDTTTTRAKAVYRDASNRLVGRARVDAAHGAAVAGDVRLVLKRDGVRIRAAKVPLNAYGTAKKVFKNLTKHGHYTVVTRYLGSRTFKRSADRARLTV